MSTMITEAVDEALDELVPLIGTKAACAATGVPRASYYRGCASTGHDNAAGSAGSAAEPDEPGGAGDDEPTAMPSNRRQAQPRALSDTERARVLEVLHSERFADASPATVYATLLDEGTYLCSISTMYRLLRERGETSERRRQATHPAKVKPELVATKPQRNMVLGTSRNCVARPSGRTTTCM